MNEAPLYKDMAEAPEGGRAFWLMSGKTRLRAALWSGGARGTVLLFTGRTEYIEKYGRVIAALVARGFCVAVLDWTGQGLSDRPADDPLKGDVPDFEDYQRDVAAFLASESIAALPGPRILLCHSMGGCIGVRALLEGVLDPAAMILSAPMLGLAMAPSTRFALGGMIGLSRRLGFHGAQVPMPGRRRAHVSAVPFSRNVLTGDPACFAWLQGHLEHEPGLALGAPSYRWLEKALSETAALAKEPAPKRPTLIFLGEEERVVTPAAIHAYAEKAESARLVILPGAKHEPLMETDEIRARLWSEFDQFLKDQGL